MNNSIILDVSEPGERIDQYIALNIDGISRARAQQLINEGMVTVGNIGPKQSYRVQSGDRITVEIPPAREPDLIPEPLKIDAVFEDGELLVVNKPRGMVVHPAPGHYSGTLVNALLYHCSDLSGIGGVLRPGIVHRLDKDTSGLLIVAKNDYTHRELSRQLKEKSIKRDYLAVIWGKLSQKKVSISAPLGRDPRNRKKMAVVEGGREAFTNVRVMARLRGATFIKAGLITGRTHQIRVHLSHIGHPVVGDPLYGGKKRMPGGIEWEGQALHARHLRFIHPRSGAPMSFTAPLPSEFRKLLQILRFNKHGKEL